MTDNEIFWMKLLPEAILVWCLVTLVVSWTLSVLWSWIKGK